MNTMVNEVEVNEVIEPTNKALLVERIFSTMDYADKSKYEITELFNRPINKGHVKKIKKGFQIYGCAAVELIVIETEAFGTKRRIIADGQHRSLAAEELGLPLDIRVMRMENDTLENIKDYVIFINNTQKGWVGDNYLEVNKFIKEVDFIRRKKKETKLSISDICIIYLGSASEWQNVKKGTNINILNEEDSDRMLKAVLRVKNVIPKNSNTRRALYKQLRSVSSYGLNAYKKFADAIIEESKTYTFNADEHIFLGELNQIRLRIFN